MTGRGGKHEEAEEVWDQGSWELGKEGQMRPKILRSRGDRRRLRHDRDNDSQDDDDEEDVNRDAYVEFSIWSWGGGL